mmetsp:Transcript_129513/g.242279  ORF Transcript_129513/g.242279 Transcript_129513/m.242279 type:complete len:504 (-) Transcript_129513:16-1527(-)
MAAGAVWRGAEHPFLGTEAPTNGGAAYMNPQAGYPPHWASSSAGPMAWQQGVGYGPTASRGSKIGSAEGFVTPQTAQFSASAHAAAAAQAAANAQAALRGGAGASAGAPPGYFGASRPPGALGAPAPQQRPSRFTGQFMPHRLCNHFSGTGFCKKADACTFAHGFHELHPSSAQQQLGYTGAPDMRATAYVPAQMQAQVEEAGLSNETAGPDKAFKFNTDAAPFAFTQFNADAAPFQPLSVKASEPDTKAEATAEAEVLAPEPAEPASAPVESQTSPTSGQSMSLPGVSRRQAPAPLTQICETPKAGEFKGTLLLGSASPTSTTAGARTGPLLTPLPTPSAAGTSAAGFVSVASSPRASVLQSPTAAKRIIVALPSPKAVTSPTNGASFTAFPGSPKVLRSPMASLAENGPATVIGSPLNRVTTPTPTNASWDRNFLLQARAVAKKLEAGPPGLANYAPTPTSAARNFGFAYPQPGYMRTVPAPSKAVAPAHGKGRKAKVRES